VTRRTKRSNPQHRFSAKSAPYLVSLLLAAAGWAVTHVVDRTLASPIIEYRTLIRPGANDDQQFRVSLSNLSSQAFANTTFEIQGSKNATLLSACDPPWEEREPAWVSETSPEMGNNAIKYNLSQLHPGWEVTLCAKFKGSGSPNFILKSTKDGRPLKLERCSIETYFVRHETGILLSLAVLWILWSLVLLFRGGRSGSSWQK